MRKFVRSMPEQTPVVPDRIRVLGRELAQVHQWLRSELARIRKEIGTDGQGDVGKLWTVSRTGSSHR